MTEETTRLISQLDDLLEAERRALLEGEYARLSELVARKEKIMDMLNDLELQDSVELSPLKGKADRNQELLQSALDGIRSVARRLADIRQARKTFNTYNHMGQKNSIEPDMKASVEKRA